MSDMTIWLGRPGKASPAMDWFVSAVTALSTLVSALCGASKGTAEGVVGVLGRPGGIALASLIVAIFTVTLTQPILTTVAVKHVVALPLRGHRNTGRYTPTVVDSLQRDGVVRAYLWQGFAFPSSVFIGRGKMDSRGGTKKRIDAVTETVARA